MTQKRRGKGPNVRQTMEPLERLDLFQVHTVGELVSAMSKCSFGARMLGLVAKKLVDWSRGDPGPIILYDGDGEHANFDDLKQLSELLHGGGVHTSQSFVTDKEFGREELVLAVGDLNPQYRQVAHEKAREIIYLNADGKVPPGHYCDGHFPNMIPSDPRFIVPILMHVLLEANGCFATSIAQAVRQLPDEGLAGQVVQAANVLLDMLEDTECTIFLTLSGAMTVAKMGLLIDDMIRLGMVDYVASTGALMAHGLIEGVGLKHYAYDPQFPDNLLAAQGLNRVTDTLEPEENFDHIDKIVHEVLLGFDGTCPLAPSDFHAALGAYLKSHHPDERAILKSAYEQGVPVVVPAFTDSEIGNDVYAHRVWRERKKLKRLYFDAELDTTKLLKMATRAKKLGIFSIGGGVPRNNTQNVAPLIEILNSRLKLKLPLSIFSYGVRIDPTPLYYGNLSGCSYSEGGSWRKFDLNGRLAEVNADATIVWPFILKYVLENFRGRDRSKIKKRKARKS